MDDENLIALQAELEETKKLKSMKEEKIVELESEIQELKKQIFEISKSGYEEMDQFIITHFQMLSDERKKTEEQNELLKTKLLKAITKKHQANNMLQALKIKSEPIKPGTDYEVENQELRIEVSKLKSDVDFQNKQLQYANQEIEKYKQQVEKLTNDKDVWVQDATKHFNILKAKLEEEREKMKSDNLGQVQLQNESLLAEIKNLREKAQQDQDEFQEKIDLIQKEKEQAETENNSNIERIKSLTENNQNLLNGQTEFLKSLNQIVGSQTLEESLIKIRELSLLPERCTKLQEKIDSLKSGEINQSHDEVIEALTEIYKKLSPNELNLPNDSTLSQLFASLCNMFNAALTPGVNKKILDAHILSVVYQARSFTPNSEIGTGQQSNNPLQNGKDVYPSVQPIQFKQPF